MREKSIKRYISFTKSLENLEKCRTKNPEDDMVLEATVLRFNLTFDLSWKVMKDILSENKGVLDFATGSPRDTMQTAFANGMIDDDIWLKMLRVRNKLAHDYDGAIAVNEFNAIINDFCTVFVKLQNEVKKYYESDTDSMDSFS